MDTWIWGIWFNGYITVDKIREARVPIEVSFK